MAAFATVVADAWRPDWITSGTALLHAVMILAVGGASALLAVFFPSFGRLFLRGTRRDLELRHHAQSLFLTRELFRTRQRLGVLVLVSLFERRIEILPDTGFHGRVSEAEWSAVIARMTPLLYGARCADAGHGLVHVRVPDPVLGDVPDGDHRRHADALPASRLRRPSSDRQAQGQSHRLV
jgi:uncharacterized membrane protein